MNNHVNINGIIEINHKRMLERVFLVHDQHL